MVEDRRAPDHQRYEVNAYVDYTGSDVLLYHQIQNISLGGVCITTPVLEEVGSIVDLQINFPDLEKKIDIRGEVVWVNREPPMDMGIRYLEVEPKTRLLLEEYIGRVKR